MKEGWEIKKLGDVCLKTSNIKWPNLNGELYDYIDLSSVSRDDFSIMKTTKVDENNAPSRAKKIIKTKDIIFATTRPTLKRLTIIPQCFDNQICSTGFVVLRPNPQKIISEFIFYSLLQDSFMARMESLQRGASYPAVTDSDVKGFEIALPPLPEQQRIVSILDQAFAAIAKARANAEQNLQNAKELFESYLQGIFENGDWGTQTLNEIAENLDSKRVPITKSKRESGDIPYYGASGIVDYVADYLFDEDLLCISEDGANLLARTYPIAFSISGKTWVNNHAHVLKFSNLITQKFVEAYINSIRIDKYVSGMAQPKLNQRMLNKIPIPLPTIEEQEAVVDKIDALRAETQKLEAVYQKKVDNLEELKKSILQKAFAGELETETIETA